MTCVFASRLSLKLALMLGLVLIPCRLWSQQSDWDQHMRAGEKAFQSLKFAKAEVEFKAALSLTQAFAATDLRTAETLGKLAEVYTSESKFAEAEEVLKRDAAATETAVGPDDPRLAYALIKLALDYEREDKPAEAAPLWSRSVAILKKAAKPADTVALSAMEGVAHSLERHGVNQTASQATKQTGEEQIYSAVLELRESLGASDQDLKNALREMASLYERTDRSSLAEPLLARVVTMDEKDYGTESFAVGIDAGQLARLYTSEWKYDAALPLLQRGLEIAETNNPPDSPSVRRHKDLVTDVDYALVLPQLPVMLMTQGLISPAGIPVHRPDEAEIFGCYKRLARGYANAGKYAEAEGMYKQIIAAEDKKEDQGRSFATTALFDDLIDFSTMYRNEHRYDEALELNRRSERVAQEIANSKFEKQNERLIGPSIYPWLSEIELAEIYREKGDTAAAEPAFEKSLQMANDVKMLPGNPPLAVMLDNYATLLRDEGKDGESEGFYKRSLNAWEQSRQPKSPDVARTLMDYAALLRKMDRPAEAEALEGRASAIHALAGAVNVN